MAAIGFISLTDYSSRPGDSGHAPLSLDAFKLSDVSLPGELAPQGRATLFVFYHPKCPCTLATARVLERLHARFATPPQLVPVAYCPADQDDSWVESVTTSALKGLADERLVVDKSGELTRRFGVIVSGHLLLYNSQGDLIFNGGITPYRGHEGDSPASKDLLDRVNSKHTGCGNWPVFGCTITMTAEARDG